ncbi:hypothetical protein SAMN05216357_11177 [Porphyromonadaceae bacterium KH3CP3RA]|nr:hypothetical protein SAMN05216357_11177 [Porphyromonadaceae bacterium KH3CP3RA]
MHKNNHSYKNLKIIIANVPPNGDAINLFVTDTTLRRFLIKIEKHLFISLHIIIFVCRCKGEPLNKVIHANRISDWS